MKKILFLFCALVVINVTFAQQRAIKPNENVVTKLEPLMTKVSSFTFDKKTNTVTKIVIDNLNIDNKLGYALTKYSDKKPIIFNATGKSIRCKPIDTDDPTIDPTTAYKREVSGNLDAGKRQYRVKLFFSEEIIDKKRILLTGNIVFSGEEETYYKSPFYIKGKK